MPLAVRKSITRKRANRRGILATSAIDAHLKTAAPIEAAV